MLSIKLITFTNIILVFYLKDLIVNISVFSIVVLDYIT